MDVEPSLLCLEFGSFSHFLSNNSSRGFGIFLIRVFKFWKSKSIFLNNYTLILLVVSSFILMNVPFRLFSLRISLRKYDYNIFKILAIILSIPIILMFGIGGFCLIIILYLFLNVISNLWSLI